MLTRKQNELLLLIRDRMATETVPPSFDEMRQALGLRSKSGIHRLISGLEERGFIRRLPHRARALEIVKMPEGAANAASPVLGNPAGSGRGGQRRARAGGGSSSFTTPSTVTSAALPASFSAQSVCLPLYGRIAAGTPIEALNDPNGQVDVPVALLATAKGGAAPQEHYALEVSGDSMIEAGIMDGDNVIVRKTATAENGAIVVALVDGQEATLKILERRPNGIALIPANPRYETRIFEAGRVAIQGQLVGLLRRY